jgi:hypothetical protein
VLKPIRTLLWALLWALPCLPGWVLARADFSAWKDSTRVFIDASATGANVPAKLINFPLLLRLNASVLDFSTLGAGGRNLRFATQDGTPLSHEIESFDAAAEEAVVWIKMPLIDSLSASQYFVMYWNNPAATDISNGAAVFDTADGYAGVWHLDDSPGEALGDTGAANVFHDATRNKNHGDDFVSGPQDKGAIGSGQAFDGVDDHVQIPSAPSLQLRGPLTLSIWCRAATLKPSLEGDTLNALIRKGDDNPNSYQLAVIGGYLTLALDADDNSGIRSKEKLIPGVYYHVAAAYEGKSAKLYVNGAFDSEFAVPTAAGALTKDDKPLQIGGRVRTGSAASHDQWHGSLDEAWVSRLSHAPAYFKMSYENQKAGSNVLSFSAFPPVTPIDPPIIAPKAAWTYDTILAAGTGLAEKGMFRLDNEGPGSVHVVIKPAGDTVAPGVEGAEALIRILVADAAAPSVIFALDSSIAAGRRVFKVLPGTGTSGRLIDLGPAAAGPTLAGSGSWIFARDTAAPVVRVLDQGVNPADSSWILLSADDNTSGVTVACVPGGVQGGSVPQRWAATGAPIRYAFLPMAGTAPVRVRFTLDDGSRATAFPAGASPAYVLSRSLPNFHAPVFLKGGLAWSLVGVPIRASHALSLGDLAGTSGADRLFVAAWKQDADDAASGEYVIGGAADSLPTGGGLWLAAGKETSLLPMGKVFSIAPGPDQSFAIRLIRGWNQIAAPALEKLPWIVSKRDLAAYDQSPVKGLHEYAGNGSYVDADTLEPWKGYFVLSDIDTTVRLSARGSEPPGSPKSAAARIQAPPARGLKVLFEPVAYADGSSPAPIGLRLGAAAYARDGLSREDEAMPTAPGQGAYLAAMRGGRGLRTDVIGLHPEGPGREGLHAWKIAWAGTRGAAPGGEPARLKLTGLDLPEGSLLWAAAPSWHLGKSGNPGNARRLSVGEIVEVPDLDGDTLAIWAASTGQWSPGDPIPGLAPAPTALAAGLKWGSQGGMLTLDLPRSSGVIASVYAVDGRCAARLKRDRLAPGRHVLPLPGIGRTQGLLFVVLDFPGVHGSQRNGPQRKILRTLATAP